MRSIRHPRRNRSVTLGPQSQADAYETLAYREKRRRESTSENAVATPRIIEKRNENGRPSGYFSVKMPNDSAPRVSTPTQLPTPAPSDVDLYTEVMGAEIAVCSPLTPTSESNTTSTPSRRPSEDRRQYEREEREMLSTLEKPRVRYDVEVITKLIVYTGRSLSDHCRKRAKLNVEQASLGSLLKATLSYSNSLVLALAGQQA